MHTPSEMPTIHIRITANRSIIQSLLPLIKNDFGSNGVWVEDPMTGYHDPIDGYIPSDTRIVRFSRCYREDDHAEGPLEAWDEPTPTLTEVKKKLRAYKNREGVSLYAYGYNGQHFYI